MKSGLGAVDAARLRPEWVLLALLTAGFFWGLGFPLMKMVSADFPAVALASLRGLLGGSTLVFWFLLMQQDCRPRTRQETMDWLVLGALNGWIPNVLTAFATQSLPGGQAAMIQACGPLITALMASRMFSDERLTPVRLTGILIGFAGVGLLIGPRLSGSGGTPAAALAMLGVACCYASGNVYVRRMPVADPRRLALGQQVEPPVRAGRAALTGEHARRVLAGALEREHAGGEGEAAGQLLGPQPTQQVGVIGGARQRELGHLGAGQRGAGGAVVAAQLRGPGPVLSEQHVVVGIDRCGQLLGERRQVADVATGIGQQPQRRGSAVPVAHRDRAPFGVGVVAAHRLGHLGQVARP